MMLIITFQESIDNLEAAHKTCSILPWDAAPPERSLINEMCFVIMITDSGLSENIRR